MSSKAWIEYLNRLVGVGDWPVHNRVVLEVNSPAQILSSPFFIFFISSIDRRDRAGMVRFNCGVHQPYHLDRHGCTCYWPLPHRGAASVFVCG